MLSGLIVIWSGAIVDIPAGWVLCNGANGTPDLRNKFVIGAGNTYAVDETGGDTEHTHGFTGDGHDHTLPGGPDIQGGINISATSTTGYATGTTDPGNTLPPFRALAFIMKT